MSQPPVSLVSSSAGQVQPVERVRLGDGSEALIREIAPDDKAKLAAAFGRLSERSRQLRFLASKPRLSNEELAYFTEVDHADHEALIGLNATGDELVGVCRYVRLPSEHDTAEAAIAVADEWQGRGLGTVLVKRLAERARALGIRRFKVVLLVENRRSMALFKKLGSAELRASHGVAELVVSLTDASPADMPRNGRSASGDRARSPRS